MCSAAVLARMNLVAYAAAVVMFIVLTVQRLLGPRPRSYGIRVGLIALMLALTMYSGMIAAPRIDELQAGVVGPMNQLSADDARRVEFDHLHGLSTIARHGDDRRRARAAGMGNTGIARRMQSWQ